MAKQMTKPTLHTATKSAVHRKSDRGNVQTVESNVAENPNDAASDASARRAMISEAAYYRAERRGFAPGFELEDWLLSENEIDTRIEAQSLQKATASSNELH